MKEIRSSYAHRNYVRRYLLAIEDCVRQASNPHGPHGIIIRTGGNVAALQIKGIEIWERGEESTSAQDQE